MTCFERRWRFSVVKDGDDPGEERNILRLEVEGLRCVEQISNDVWFFFSRGNKMMVEQWIVAG